MKKTYKSILENIEVLAEDCEEFFSSKGIAPNIIFAFNLSLDEIFTNIVTYGYSNSKDKDIEVDFSIENNIAKVVVKDYAYAFNPLKEIEQADTSSDIDNRKIGGLGIFFCKKNMDDITYIRENNANILTLIKKL